MNLNRNSIAIVGRGVFTAVGLDAQSTAAAVRAGIDGFEEHPFMVNQLGEPYVLASVPSVDTTLRGEERFMALTLPPLEEALRSLPSDRVQLSVTIGFPEKRPGVPNGMHSRLKTECSALNTDNLSITSVRSAFRGHAAGLMAIESACQQLLDGDSEFAVAGGVDSYIDPDALDWVENNEQLHHPANAWGFIPGEAGAFCLLCTANTAEHYGLPVSAWIKSAATEKELNCIKTKSVCLGEGLTAAMRSAIEFLPEDIRINQMYCDMNGEAYRADEFGFTIVRLASRFNDAGDYQAPADCWGDVGAASGPLFVNQICDAKERSYSSGPLSLLWASSEGGDRSAMVLMTEHCK